MNEVLKNKINAIDCSSISKERKERLMLVAEAIKAKITSLEGVNLIFVCTHNSRRSQFAQIWAHVMADYFSLPMVHSYSAGTEATALYPSVMNALKEDLSVEKVIPAGTNPYYLLKFSANAPVAICFSKTLENPLNPQSNFIAIMTCSEADKGCPMVAGASHRISLPFEDPKQSDGQADEMETYRATSTLIATELKFIFSQV